MRADEELLDAWCAGETGAGNELFSRHFDLLCRFFVNKVGDESNDLIQQSFLACVRNRENFRKESSFRTYLLQIARSKLYDHLRSKGRSLVDPDFGVSSVQALSISPSSAVGRSEEHALLLRSLRELPVDLQTVLELYYWEDLTAEELADALGVPVGTAKSRLRRAREALSERLGGKLPNRVPPPER